MTSVIKMLELSNLLELSHLLCNMRNVIKFYWLRQGQKL